MEGNKIEVAVYPTLFLQWMGFYVKDFTFFAILKIVFVMSFFHIITIGLWGHLIYYIANNSFVYEFIADDIAGILSSYVGVYFQISFVAMSKKCRKLLVDLGEFEKYDVPDRYAERVKKFDTMFKYTLYFYFLADFLIVLFLLNRKCQDGVISDCGLVIIAYLPFDIFYTPARQIFMVLQLYSGFGSAVSSVCIVIILIYAVECLGMQIRHLEKLLMEIVALPTRELRKLQIKKCVLYHYRILGLHEKVASISAKILFPCLFMMPIIISLTSYQLIAIKLDAVTLIHLFNYFITLLLTCTLGENFIEASQNLCFTAYDAIPWDNDYETARDLYIIMMATSRELSLPAGKFGPVGHIRFMMAIKASYSFLTLLLNTK